VFRLHKKSKKNMGAKYLIGRNKHLFRLPVTDLENAFTRAEKMKSWSFKEKSASLSSKKTGI
jgi:hypothetical protein